MSVCVLKKVLFTSLLCSRLFCLFLKMDQKAFGGEGMQGILRAIGDICLHSAYAATKARR